MKYKVIGIAGPAGCGKDVAADRILAAVRGGYSKESFADPLKKMLQIGLGLTHGQLYGEEKQEIDPRYGCTPRHMMQTLGTEWGRNTICSDIWIKAMQARVDCHPVIVPDVRFESEAAFIREHGILIRIIGRQPFDDDHVSESGVCHEEGDISIYNTGSLENYLDLIDSVISIELS